jgi:hypothetical protein
MWAWSAKPQACATSRSGARVCRNALNAVRARHGAEARGCDAEHLAEAAAHAAAMKPVPGGPRAERKRGVLDQRARQQIGPVVRHARARPQGAADECCRVRHVALGGADDRVAIGEPAQERACPCARDGHHEHFGTARVEAVEVTFEGLVDQHVAGPDAMTAGIARFGVASGQHDGGEAVRMLVPREHFVRRVEGAVAGRSVPGMHVKSVQDSRRSVALR